MERAPQAKNIYQKLLSVMGKIGKVEKKGVNNFHKYNYVKEEDLVEALRSHLIEEGLFITSSLKSHTVTGDLTAVTVLYRITNADQPAEFIELEGGGYGKDSGDKGIYKALTGSMKYFLMKNFLIDTGYDPESEQKQGRAATAKPAVKPSGDQFQQSIKMIGAQQDPKELRAWRKRIEANKTFTVEQKEQLLTRIDAKLAA